MTEKRGALRTSFDKLQSFFCFLQSGSQLIGAGGRLHTAVDALHALDDLIHIHTFHQSADALQVAISTTQVLYIVNFAVFNFKEDSLGTGSLGLVLKLHL